MTKDAEPYDQVVALTGIRHSGKSTASRFFAERGATVVSADDLARKAVEKGSEGLQRVSEHFGTSILDTDGNLDRRKMADLIYKNPEHRKMLESIVHPIVRDLAHDEFRSAIHAGAKLILYDCPLYFEGKLDQLGFRGVIVLRADPDRAVRRIMERDGITESEARTRLGSQLSQDDKLRRATWILDNRGSLADLESQVDLLFQHLSS